MRRGGMIRRTLVIELTTCLPCPAKMMMIAKRREIRERGAMAGKNLFW